ncbi:translation initiation factor IF-2-like [Aquila chrysaetos chrysaetos]|uniref:translation initiation factor IF-2-like n=1 Tax=Aquila chrysaetos chrysaetos TaxID=223781 RepID=UPI001B7D3C1F|nr:translation initiation factor IF-2-like [Aquila chrysaetos chrysaetos]
MPAPDASPARPFEEEEEPPPQPPAVGETPAAAAAAAAPSSLTRARPSASPPLSRQPAAARRPRRRPAGRARRQVRNRRRRLGSCEPGGGSGGAGAPRGLLGAAGEAERGGPGAEAEKEEEEDGGGGGGGPRLACGRPWPLSRRGAGNGPPRGYFPASASRLPCSPSQRNCSGPWFTVIKSRGRGGNQPEHEVLLRNLRLNQPVTLRRAEEVMGTDPNPGESGVTRYRPSAAWPSPKPLCVKIAMFSQQRWACFPLNSQLILILGAER